MAFDDYKITENDENTTGVVSQPDTLTGTVQQNKAVFDALPRLIIDRLNSLIDAIQAQASAAELGAAPFEGVEATTVQAALQALQTNLNQYGQDMAADGAGSVGVTPFPGVEAATAQGALEALQDNINALKALLLSEAGAEQVGVTPFPGVASTLLQDALEELQSEIDDINAGLLPDYSVTWDKLSQDIVDAINAPGSGSLLTITFDETFEGLPYTLTGNGESYSGTVPETLTEVCSLQKADADYLLTVTDVANDESWTRTIHTEDWFTSLAVSIAPFAATITVTCPAGSTVTCAKGETTLQQTATSGTAVFTVGETGTWTITATLDGETASGEVVISADGDSKSIELAYVTICAVAWEMSNSSTACARVTPENDPANLVNKAIGTEPVPAVGTGAGSSPFDDILPWSGMYECNVNTSGVETAKKGESGFSRSTADVMIWIPQFWYKVADSGGKRYFYIADRATDGFALHPGSGQYVSRYTAASGYQSKTGVAPLANITRAQARSGAAGKGANWCQYDFAAYCAVILLYLVEYADWDSQSTVGRGYADGNSSAINNGGTDAMTYHTGRASGTDGKTAVQYRGIENPWGNVFQWVDGINFTERQVRICTDPDDFADDTNTGYTAVGVTLPSSGWIKGLGLSSAFPWAMLPDENGGSDSTYIPDYVGSDTGWRVLRVGGSWDSGSDAGLLYFNANNTSSNSNANIGARLIVSQNYSLRRLFHTAW